MSTENKLPEDFKKKWIEALRSGEYKQGQGVLYHEGKDCFCCLGVAGVIAGMPKEHLNGRCAFGLDATHFEVYPPKLLQLLVHDFPSAELIRMNDDEDKSFPEIADWIEQNL